MREVRTCGIPPAYHRHTNFTNNFSNENSLYTYIVYSLCKTHLPPSLHSFLPPHCLLSPFPPSLLPRPSLSEEKRPSSAQLVTAHGTYATQSAFTAAPVQKEEKM